MSRYGNLGNVSRPRGGVMAIGKVGPRQAHGYRNCFGMVGSNLSGYAGMLGAPSGPVTLANIRPGAAYGDVGAKYEGRTPMHGLYGGNKGSNGGGKSPMPSGGGGGGGGVTPDQIGQWFNFGLQAAQQIGMDHPGQGGPSSSSGLPPAGGGPRTGGTSMYRPPPPVPKKKMSPWAVAAIIGGAVLVVGAGAYTLS